MASRREVLLGAGVRISLIGGRDADQRNWGERLLGNEELDDFRIAVAAGMAKGNAAVPAQRNFLVLEREFQLPVERHIGAVGALIHENIALAAPLDAGVIARGTTVCDDQIAIRIAPEAERVAAIVDIDVDVRVA